MSELKPCQCGAKAEYIEEDGGHWIVCHNGHETAIFDCKEDLMEFWQSRPIEDALQSRITELEESLYGADSQKAELEGMVNSLNNAFAELPDFLSENCLTIADLTPELLKEYLSLLSEKPEREVVK